jgi:hypothetical protein
MFQANQELLSPFDFDNAKFFAVPVYVLQDGEKIDFGKITKHTEDCVFVNDGYFSCLAISSSANPSRTHTGISLSRGIAFNSYLVSIFGLFFLK